MKKSIIVDKLNDFISGIIDAEDLAETIDERLFKLRQKPDVTPEQELLSNLELYIHEAKEGYRSWDELYEYVLSIIERNISERNSTTIILNNYATSELSTVTRSAIPVKDYHPDPLLV